MSEHEGSKDQQIAAALQDLGERVEPARAFDLPQINYDRFGKQAASIKSACEDIMRFPQTPFRYDKFESDHRSRRVWFDNIRKTFGNAVEQQLSEIGKNKFRNNVALLATANMQGIEMELAPSGSDNHLINKLHILNQQTESVARTLTRIDQNVEERKVQIMHLEDLAAQFLRELSVWSHEPTK